MCTPFSASRQFFAIGWCRRSTGFGVIRQPGFVAAKREFTAVSNDKINI
jgi:hypothetical protein